MMPTRHGWTVLAASAIAAAVGRVFGILELYVIAVGALAALLLGVLAVAVRRHDVVGHRWIHPPILTVGDAGRVDLTLSNAGRGRSPQLDVSDPVGPNETARVTVGPLGARQHVEVAYRLPASRRGVLTLGPLRVEHRDQLGLAVRRSVAAPTVEVVVAPRAHQLSMPELGRGVLGRHVLSQAQRLGAGEFHSLRDYVEGDEPRLINWRASARGEELKVRQHTTEGVRRCIVVLDRDIDGEAFERAVVAAASLVQSADRAGLTTRFVTSDGVDLRGPDVAATTLGVLARVTPASPELAGGRDDEIERDPGEGLGLVVVVTSCATSSTWRRTDAVLDPTLVRVGVFTGTDHDPVGPVGRLGVDASTIEGFVVGWEALAGRRTPAGAR